LQQISPEHRGFRLQKVTCLVLFAGLTFRKETLIGISTTVSRINKQGKIDLPNQPEILKQLSRLEVPQVLNRSD
jgi:hypothetical protein